MSKSESQNATVTLPAIGASNTHQASREFPQLRDAQESFPGGSAEGVIVADVAVIDPARVEPRIVLHVQVEMNTQDRKVMEAFQHAMRASPEVQGAWDVTGETDYLLTVAVRSMQDYEAFGIRELIPEKGVRGFKSMIVIREVVGFDPARVALER